MKSMKQIISLTLFMVSATISFGQNTISEKYIKADSFLKVDRIFDAYNIFKEMHSGIKNTDSLYPYVVWFYMSTASQLGKKSVMKEDYSHSLEYSLEALKLIRENKNFFTKKFSDQEAWQVKNVIVAYTGSGKIDASKKYKDFLYAGYKGHTLPVGIDQYFNFDYFKIGDKNVWGYEWYHELPDNRVSSSFTKIVYYVYSTNTDGTDKEQLYRFHVLMFHQNDLHDKFDYILERQQEENGTLVSGSYFSYKYNKEIDYKKLRADINEIVNAGLFPDTKRISSLKR